MKHGLPSPGTMYSVVARRGHRMPRPSARKPPARHSIPRFAARFTMLDWHQVRSMSFAWDWLVLIHQMTAKSLLDGLKRQVGLVAL